MQAQRENTMQEISLHRRKYRHLVDQCMDRWIVHLHLRHEQRNSTRTVLVAHFSNILEWIDSFPVLFITIKVYALHS